MDRLLMNKVCEMFYYDGLSKIEISKNLRISRFKVARIIDEARRSGMVQIHIVNPFVDFYSLEKELEKRLGLRAVMIIEGVENNELLNRQLLGQAAAKYLTETLGDGDFLGIAWGQTVKETINTLPQNVSVDIKGVVQVSGGLALLNSVENVTVLNALGSRLKTTVSPFIVPLIVGNEESKKQLLEDENIRRTIDLFDKVTIALTGIGSTESAKGSNLIEEANFSDEERKYILSKGGIGDILNHIFNENGEIISGEFGKRLMTIDIETARKIKHIVAVAGGAYKAPAIIGAVRTGLVDVLLTDSFAAKSILDILNKA
jgi:DNA-binding transcriptional regulator LsrR (DeoR family)